MNSFNIMFLLFKIAFNFSFVSSFFTTFYKICPAVNFVIPPFIHCFFIHSSHNISKRYAKKSFKKITGLIIIFLGISGINGINQFWPYANTKSSHRKIGDFHRLPVDFNSRRFTKNILSLFF